MTSWGQCARVSQRPVWRWGVFVLALLALLQQIKVLVTLVSLAFGGASKDALRLY